MIFLKDLKPKNFLKAILEDYPNFKIKNYRLINKGWDFIALEINNEHIFRFPKKSRYVNKLELELRVLDRLKGKISLPIPKIIFVGKRYVYLGHKKIKGESLGEKIINGLSGTKYEKLTFDLAKFTHEFHNSLSLKEAIAIGVKPENMSSYSKFVSKLMPKVKKRINDRKVIKFIEETLNEYKALIKEKPDLTFLYNDLHGDNMAFDKFKGRLNGIFDFGDVALGDISLDFKELYRYGHQFLEDVAAKFEKMSGIRIDLRKAVVFCRIEILCDIAEFIDHPESKVFKRAINFINRWINEVDIYNRHTWKYVFRKYRPEYFELFKLEKKRLGKLLGDKAKIEHVGSTSVPGLGGKGFLDILIGLPKYRMIKAKQKIIKAGFEFRELFSTPERWYFRKDYPYKGGQRRVHLHLTEFNSRDWKEMMGFRDYLINHPEVLKQYAEIKKEGAEIAEGDGYKYRKHKEDFIKKVISKALNEKR